MFDPDLKVRTDCPMTKLKERDRKEGLQCLLSPRFILFAELYARNAAELLRT